MYFKKIITTSILVLFMAGAVLAQDVTLNVQDNYEMRLDGEANVRSWDAEITDLSGSLVLTELEERRIENLTAESFKEMSLTIPVESLDSGSGGLDKNMHKYLKEKDYPNITFSLTEVTSIEAQEDGTALITANGVVNAAGKNHDITMNVTAKINDDGSINFTGEQELLMTSFDIDPPTAVFGTVRARDEMLISFNVNFN
jgi:polyisoprenoid-binding protein YceI